MKSTISFVMGGKVVTLDFEARHDLTPHTTVLTYLRNSGNRRSVKEGCAVGDCGACTVVVGEIGPHGRIEYKAINSCLLFLPMIDGKQLLTAEDLCANGILHPVQQAMVDAYGSQCGFCTPGIVMAMFALYRNASKPSREEAIHALSGTLCRCTGYRPIIDAALKACAGSPADDFKRREAETAGLLRSLPRQSFVAGKEKYIRPVTLAETFTLREQYPDAVVIAGGTDVALRVTRQHETLPAILDISAVDVLRKISESDDALTIGAGVPLSEILPAVAARFPALYEMFCLFGSRQIRNCATLGGSLGTASPIGDALPVLIAYGAKVVLERQGGRRELAIDNFVTGYRQSNLGRNELITSVILPKHPRGAFVRSYKISKRKDVDIATLSGGFRLQLNGGSSVDSIVLAYGGMAGMTKRATAVERFLTGKPWERETVEESMAYLEQDFTPISDARGSARFRMTAAKNLLLKFWHESQSRGGEGA